MSDACLICETEAISLDDWYLKTTSAHGQIVVIECICRWCVKDMHEIRELVKTHDGSNSHARKLFDKIDILLNETTAGDSK